MNGMTLEEWMNHYHSTDEMRHVFCAQSRALKKVHEQGYYVTDFNLNQIVVGEYLNRQKYITFKQVRPFQEKEEKKSIHQNIKMECFQEIGLYCSMLSDMTISFTPTFLKENFDRFSPFIPEEDFPFYKKVFVYNAVLYLSDYIEKNNQSQMNKLEEELEGGANRSYSKSTAVGRALKDPQELPDNHNQAGIMQIFVLPFVILFLSLIIPLLAMLIGSR